MSEMIGCTVRVKIPASWLTYEVTETYRGSGSFFEAPSWREPDPDNDDDPVMALWNLSENIGGYLDVNGVEGQPGVVTATMQGELNYGFYADDVDRGGELVRLRIPFWAQNDAKYEYAGDVTWFDGNPDGILGGSSADNDGDPYVLASHLRAMWEAASQGDFNPHARFGKAVVDLIDGLRFDLDACDISHLIP